jgi:hypothetical protein
MKMPHEPGVPNALIIWALPMFLWSKIASMDWGMRVKWLIYPNDEFFFLQMLNFKYCLVLLVLLNLK